MSDTDSIVAEQADHVAGSDDGRPVSEVDDEIWPHEEISGGDSVGGLVRPSVAVMRAGFAQLDSWDLQDLFRQRGCLLKSVPRFLWGSFRICLKIALEGVEAVFVVAKDDVPQTPSWRPHGQGQVGGQVRRIRSRQVARFDSGQRQVFYRRCGGDQTPPKERCPNIMEKRAARALKLIQVGELSAGRHALEVADLVGNTATLKELRQRPANTRDTIPPVPVDGTMFNLEERVFCRNVRSGRKGAAGAPSGMTNDHLRPLLDSTRQTFTLQSGELMARVDAPPTRLRPSSLGG